MPHQVQSVWTMEQWNNVLFIEQLSVYLLHYWPFAAYIGNAFILMHDNTSSHIVTGGVPQRCRNSKDAVVSTKLRPKSYFEHVQHLHTTITKGGTLEGLCICINKSQELKHVIEDEHLPNQYSTKMMLSVKLD